MSDNCGDDRKKRFVDVMSFNSELTHFILYIYKVFSLTHEADHVEGAAVLDIQHLIALILLFK